MAVDPQLRAALVKKLGLSERQVNRLIAEHARELLLPREQAALALAAENSIHIAKFASAEDLADLRQATGRTSTGPQQASTAVAEKGGTSTRTTRRSKSTKATTRKKTGKRVFVVHGRDTAKADALFDFLRAIDLAPMEFSKLRAATKKASPYIGEILDQAFKDAVAVVVLLTPDDEARLLKRFQKSKDPPYEKNLTGQARPNVLFEAGMAFGHAPDQTVLVQIGEVRPFSDVAGRHTLYLDNSAEARLDLAERLRTAGCLVDTGGRRWLTVGDFEA